MAVGTGGKVTLLQSLLSQREGNDESALLPHPANPGGRSLLSARRYRGESRRLARRKRACDGAGCTE
jgi:hypothetical protein